MTINEVQEQIIQEMAAQEDEMDRYKYLIDLGKNHPDLEARYRTEANALPGCQYRVWIHAEERDGRLRFRADSDSTIIRGILALVLRVLNNRSRREIATADLYFVEKTGLSTRLSPTRAHGVATIIKRMRSCGSDGDTAR
jgi:cysteine desulfuration protein SufE